MRKALITFVIIIFSNYWITAQICTWPGTVDYIHVNNVRAAILNEGDNFWDLDLNGKFQVPYAGPQSPLSIFASALWLTGFDEDNVLRGSAVKYRQSFECGYEPGPILDDGSWPNDENYLNWNKIFSVHQQDILVHIEDAKDGTIDFQNPTIFGWPSAGNKFFKEINGFHLEFGATGGAYFHEVSGAINGIYEPHLGEYPHIEGMNPNTLPGEIKWCVYNNGATISSIHSKPLSFEIQQTVYAMSCTDEILANTLFISYRIINKSNIDFKDVTLAQWNDFDLGCHLDDFIGCMPSINTSYIYNIDSIDDGCEPSNYKGNLPIQTMTFLNSKMSSHMYYRLGPTYHPPAAQGSPSILKEYNNYMNAKWRDGTPLTYGKTGFNTGNQITKFAFPSVPIDTAGWSMKQVKIYSGDIENYSVNSTKRNQFNKNDIWNIDLAFTHHNDYKSNHLEMVDYALDQIPKLQKLYKDGFKDCSSLELCDCDCVWTGDTDNNGMVNTNDFVNVIRGLGKTGSERNGPLAWIGQSVEDWSSASIEGINLKHADVNGDGIITNEDLNPIQDFINNKTMCFDTVPTKNCLSGSDLVWVGDGVDSLTLDCRTKKAFLKLNSDKPFEGLSYEIQYDGTIFRHTIVNDSLEWDNEEIGIRHSLDNINDIKIIEFQFNTSRSNLKILSKNILELDLHLRRIPRNYPTPYTEIKICNAKMHFADRRSKNLGFESFKYYFDSTVKVAVKNISNKPTIQIHPNPVRDQIKIITDRTYLNFQLIDINGTILKKANFSNSNYSIDVSSIPNGIYFLIFKLEDMVLSKKIIIQK